MQQPVVPNKVFVGGIPRSATQDELLKAAQAFGPVKFVKLIKNITNSSATFGFVSFWSAEPAQKMLAARVKVHGKAVECRATMEYGQLKAANEELLKRKVYIGGFSKQLKEAKVLKMFEAFGEVEEVVINRDVQSSRSRGSGFVIFKSEEVCREVVNREITELADQRMIVLPCKRRGLINKGLSSNSVGSTEKPPNSSSQKESAKHISSVKISSFQPKSGFAVNATKQEGRQGVRKTCKVFYTATQHTRIVAENHFHENLRFNFGNSPLDDDLQVERKPFTIECLRELKESSESRNFHSGVSS